VARDKRHLSPREKNNQNKNSWELKGDPGIVRLGAPNDLVQKRKREKEASPTQGEEPPAGLGQGHGIVENDRQNRLVHREAADERNPEAGIEHGRLHLDEGGILQIKSEPAENEHQYRSHQRHGRQPPCRNKRDGEGDGDRRHQEDCGGEEPGVWAAQDRRRQERRNRGLEKFWPRVREKE
jgi:hypothetical protein